MRFKWTIEIEVDELWVADGFDMESYAGCTGDEAAMERLSPLLPYANDGEYSVRVLKRPERKDVRRVQGYPARARG